MASTAIGAAGEDARTITFMSREHKEFYLEYLPKCRWKDVYHEALVYCLGIDRDTRKHVNKIYDFKNGSVKPECLQEGGGKTTTTINLGVVFRLLSQLCCNIGTCQKSIQIFCIDIVNRPLLIRKVGFNDIEDQAFP